MEKIGSNILKIIFCAFFLVFFYIILNGYLDYDTIIYTFNPILLILGTIMYIISLSFFYNKILDKLCRIKGFEYLLFFIFAILAILAGRYFRLNQTWDMGAVLNIAIEYSETGTYTGNYLSRCSNNIMMTCIEIIIFKISSVFGNIDYIDIITVVNSIIVILTVVLSFFIVKKIFNRKKAIFYMCICLITTPLYLYTAVYYTDVWSMFITILLLGTWILIENTNKKVLKFSLQILFGLLLFIGIKLKTTSIFIFVAILLCLILKGKIKYTIRNSIIILCTTLICCIIYNCTLLNLFTTDESRNRYELPYEHYFMMGMQERGGWNPNANYYTDSFITFKEKKEANIEMIKQMLKERDVATHIKFLESKLGYTWHDGSYFVVEKLRRMPVNEGKLHEVIYGKYSRYYKYLPQVMHFSMLILIMLNLMKKIKNKQYFENDTNLLITIFGFLVFLMFWETRSRYLVTILPIMIICQINGLEYLVEEYEKKKGIKVLSEKNK